MTGSAPRASTATSLPGLACSTVVTARSTMSKSRQLRSKRWPSAASTVARLVVPVRGAPWRRPPAPVRRWRRWRPCTRWRRARWRSCGCSSVLPLGRWSEPPSRRPSPAVRRAPTTGWVTARGTGGGAAGDGPGTAATGDERHDPPRGPRARRYAGGMESYAAGETSPALLEETIGANFERTVAAYAGPRGAGRGGHRPALDLGRARPRRRRAGPRPDRRPASRKGDRVGIWAPNCAEWTLVQYATAQGRRDPRQRQPGVPHPRARLRRRAQRDAAAGLRLGFKTSDYRAMVEQVRDRVPDARAHGVPRHRRLGRAGRRGRGAAGGCAGRADGDAGARRPDQHPVHVRHHRPPQGRDAQPPQHPQQRLLHHRADQPHRAGPALHPGALLPLLRDGDGQPRLHLPRRHDGDPGARLRPRDHAARHRRGALHRGVRRADDVHRDAAPPDLRRARPLRACAPGSWPARSARSR